MADDGMADAPVERELGFYWAKGPKGNWVPLWFGGRRWWWGKFRVEHDPVEIGPRILPPDEIKEPK